MSTVLLINYLHILQLTFKTGKRQNKIIKNNHLISKIMNNPLYETTNTISKSKKNVLQIKTSILV